MQRRRFWQLFNSVMAKVGSCSGISRQHFTVDCAIEGERITSVSMRVGSVCRHYAVTDSRWAEPFIDDAGSGAFGPPRTDADVRAQLGGNLVPRASKSLQIPE